MRQTQDEIRGDGGLADRATNTVGAEILAGHGYLCQDALQGRKQNTL
jgi:hypothetical protein